jgi:hypothetical protein
MILFFTDDICIAYTGDIADGTAFVIGTYIGATDVFFKTIDLNSVDLA